MKRYEYIDHTADIGMRAYGDDLKGLFINAAGGMFALITDLKDVLPKKTIKVTLKAPNLEELFLSWLSELLFYFSAKQLLLNSFVIDSVSEQQLQARVRGEKLDLKRHKFKTEIKAATYHQLKVEKFQGKYRAEVIFDL